MEGEGNKIRKEDNRNEEKKKLEERRRKKGINQDLMEEE